jgi:hypothetical protein
MESRANVDPAGQKEFLAGANTLPTADATS